MMSLHYLLISSMDLSISIRQILDSWSGISVVDGGKHKYYMRT